MPDNNRVPASSHMLSEEQMTQASIVACLNHALAAIYSAHPLTRQGVIKHLKEELALLDDVQLENSHLSASAEMERAVYIQAINFIETVNREEIGDAVE